MKKEFFLQGESIKDFLMKLDLLHKYLKSGFGDKYSITSIYYKKRFIFGKIKEKITDFGLNLIAELSITIDNALSGYVDKKIYLNYKDMNKEVKSYFDSKVKEVYLEDIKKMVFENRYKKFEFLNTKTDKDISDTMKELAIKKHNIIIDRDIKEKTKMLESRLYLTLDGVEVLEEDFVGYTI